MLPKLVALDVDGTLRDPDAVMTDRTKAAVAATREAGAHIVVATGRPWAVAQRDVDELGGVAYAICSNGAMAVRAHDEAVTLNVMLDAHEPERIVRALREAVPGIGLAFEFETGAKSEPGWAERLPAGVPLGRPVDDVLSLLGDTRGPVRRVIAFHDDYDNRNEDLVALAVEVAGPGLKVETGGLPFIDIGPQGVHKAAGLQHICAELAVPQAGVIAFGDEANDRHMLEWAGHGVAMGNASAEAIAVADAQTLSNAEDGVAVYLEALLQRHS